MAINQADLDRIDVLRERIREELSAIELPDHPEGLYEPVRYVLDGVGKGLRPLVVLLTADGFGASVSNIMPAALAVEVFHSFTLVHDDIMDNSDQRRGKPTVHEVWDVGTGILTGDLLMGLSYDLIARTQSPEIVQILRAFYKMVQRLCEGQNLDETFEHRDDVTLEEYLDMIGRKTGALLEFSFWMGAVLGGADTETADALRRVGHHAGVAFQIQDDLLDLTATDDGWGKPVGGDLVEGKKTYLLLRAFEMGDDEDVTWFSRVLYGGLESDDIPEARERMEKIGVLKDAREATLRAYEESSRILKQVEEKNASVSFSALHTVLDKMKSRLT